MADEPKGPDYRDYAGPLLNLSGELAHAVAAYRPEAMGMSPASGPEIIIDLWRLRCTVVVRLDEQHVRLLDEFTLDPQDPNFGISRIPHFLRSSSGDSGLRH